MWRWLLCLSFLAVVLSDELPENPVPAEIKGIKLLPREGQDLSRLQEIVHKLLRFNDKEQVAELNEYSDELLTNLNEFIVTTGLDPISMPGFEESFQWTIFFGWVSLDDGWLRGLATIKRSGDVILKYEYPNVKIHVPVGFSDLKFDYHYEAIFMGLGPKGMAKGTVKGCKFTVDIDINMTNLRINLDKFKLNTLGKVTLKFTGSVVGSIANILIGIVLPILQPIIKIVLEGFITGGLHSMLDFYNSFICGVLGDCPQLLGNLVY